jgi:hypothetical protein
MQEACRHHCEHEVGASTRASAAECVHGVTYGHGHGVGDGRSNQQQGRSLQDEVQAIISVVLVWSQEHGQENAHSAHADSHQHLPSHTQVQVRETPGSCAKTSLDKGRAPNDERLLADPTGRDLEISDGREEGARKDKAPTTQDDHRVPPPIFALIHAIEVAETAERVLL